MAVVDTITIIHIGASNEGSRRFHNHREAFSEGPFLEPSPCWMHLRALSHVRTYYDIMIMLNRREPTVSRWMLNWDTDAMVISDRLFG